METMTVPDIISNDIVFTKNRDRIIISLDSNLYEFEKREAFIANLYEYFIDNGIKDTFKDRMNKKDDQVS